MGYRRVKFRKQRNNPVAKRLRDHEFNYRKKVVDAKRFEPRDIKLSDLRQTSSKDIAND